MERYIQGMNKKGSGERGSVWIEAAMVIPLFVLFVLFLLEITILLIRYTAIHEGIAIAAREISLPPKNSQIYNPDPLPICNEIVSIRINEQMRSFRQSMNQADFETVVKQISTSELAIYTAAKHECFVCISVFGASYYPFTWNFEEPVILQDKSPPCQVDG